MLYYFSGAHVNPAVTTGALLAGDVSVGLAVMYVLSQFIGSVTGALFARVMICSPH